MDDLSAVILAAGEGTRMKSCKPKALQEVLFKPMLEWVYDSIREAGINSVCIVAGGGAELLKQRFEGRCEIVEQKERLGTGHAVMAASEFLKAHAGGNAVILCGDAPFIDGDTIKNALNEHIENKNCATVITAETDSPFGYGRIKRGEDGSVVKIVEEKDATAEEKKIKEINGGAYWFKTGTLLDTLGKIKNDNAKGEYYLTSAVDIIAAEGMKCGSFKTGMGCTTAANDRQQLLALNELAKAKIIDTLMQNGVSFVDLSGVVIGPDVSVGKDTVILPGTIIRGRTVIGEGCTIGPGSLITDCEFGSNIVFNASQAANSKIGDKATIGPFTHIRPNTVVHSGVHVGDFVELKNSEIGEGTKVPHLTYVGDSDVGSHVNFGCGCVTVNYDGVLKHRTTVGDNAFIGCNTNLVAPVKVGDNAYTAAGSTITRDIPDNALAVARSRQENKEGWVLKKKAKPHKG